MLSKLQDNPQHQYAMFVNYYAQISKQHIIKQKSKFNILHHSPEHSLEIWSRLAASLKYFKVKT